MHVTHVRKRTVIASFRAEMSTLVRSHFVATGRGLVREGVYAMFGFGFCRQGSVENYYFEKRANSCLLVVADCMAKLCARLLGQLVII
jgi:hypothetical protein